MPASTTYDCLCNRDNWIMSEKPNQKSPKRHVSGQQQLAPQTGGAAPKLSAVGRRYSMCVPAISLTTTVSLDSHGSMDPPPTLDLVPLRRTSSNKYHPKSLFLSCPFVWGNPAMDAGLDNVRARGRYSKFLAYKLCRMYFS